MLLALAPGLRVVRRGRQHVQVGLYDERRLVLPRGPATTHVLTCIDDGLPVDLEQAGVATTVHRLVSAGCAVPAGAAGPRRRAEGRVAVVGRIGADPGPLLEAAGLGPPLLGREQALLADVTLVLCRGEPDREDLDPWMRHGLAHLVVRDVDAGVVLGPFVRPGRSACLRCIDAHQADLDPDHLPVLARYSAASRQARRGDDDAEPALVALALAWAVRDLVSHLDGGRPSSSSRTIRLGPEPDREVHTDWARHRECGCCW